jgi:GR25 family glycosyltransferase involved in LPS biosynthesis
VTYAEVNDQINRAKVHVLWSRKEGVNRAIVECMFAGVPSIVREGFNYGYRYPYINDETGCYATERDLPQAILTMIDRSPSMVPRDWVMRNMSCQRATEVLHESVAKWCHAHGEQWSEPPVVKCTQLNGMRYWNPDDANRFTADYDFIKSCRRPT